MKFVIDNQLPPQLATALCGLGHDSVHVAQVGLDSANDVRLWEWALGEDRIVVSKDEDFLFLANRPNDVGHLLWVRLGNCRTPALIDAVNRSIQAIEAAFKSGQRIVELA